MNLYGEERNKFETYQLYTIKFLLRYKLISVKFFGERTFLQGAF